MPFYFPYPSRGPTSGEYKVFVFTLAILSIGLGATALWLGYSAPAEKQKAAETAMFYGKISVALGVLLLAGYAIVRRV